MKRTIQVVTAVIFLLAVLLIASTVYVSSHLDQFKDIITTKIEEATGRNFHVGEAEMALSFNPSIKIKDVSLENAKWGSRPQMVKAEEIVFSIDWFALLLGDIEFYAIHMIGSDIYLETNAQGQGNWIIFSSLAKKFISSEQKSNKGTYVLDVRELDIENGELFYRDGISNRIDNVAIDRLTLHRLFHRLSSGNTQSVDFEGNYRKHPVKVSGQSGTLKCYLQNGSFPIDLNIKTTGVQLDVSGNILQPMNFQGLSVELNGQVDTLASLSWISGEDLPPYGPLSLRGHLSDDKKGYTVDGLSVALAESDISGSMAVSFNKTKPKIIARLTASKIAQTDFKTDEPAGASEKSDVNPQSQTTDKKAPLVFSEKPLPLARLNDIDADVSFSARNILLDSVAIKDLKFGFLLENGLLKTNDISGKLAGGTIAADLIVDASSQVAKVTGNIHANQLDLGTLLNAMTGEESVQGGQTDLDLDVSAQGNSVRSLASSLNGQLVSTTGKALLNYDLSLVGGNLIVEIFKKINPLAEKQKTSELECVVVHFDIKDGIASTDKGLAYESKSLKALGKGTINLKDEKIDILLSSKSTVASLLQIKGPLAKPEVGLNPVEVLKKGTSLGAAILTGGLSYAAETIFDRVTTEGSPCEIAREGIPRE